MVLLKNKRTGKIYEVDNEDPIVEAVKSLDSYKEFIIDLQKMTRLNGPCWPMMAGGNLVYRTYTSTGIEEIELLAKDVHQGNWVWFPDTELGRLLYGK